MNVMVVDHLQLQHPWSKMMKMKMLLLLQLEFLHVPHFLIIQQHQSNNMMDCEKEDMKMVNVLPYESIYI